MSDPLSTIDKYLQVTTEQEAKPNNEVIFLLRQANDDYEQETWMEYDLHLHGNKRNEANDLFRNKIDDDEVTILYLSFKENTFITGLDLGYNMIGDKGAITLGHLLQETVALRTLILSYNDICVEGTIAIAKGLQLNETLRVLKLDGNKCGANGGMSIAGALQVNTTLEELNMNNTEQNSQSLIAFTTVLAINRSIQIFDVGRPLLQSEQEETTVHIARMLEVNVKIHQICLSKHGMKNFGAERLMEHIYHNIVLKHLDLSCNRISRDGMKFIADYLQTNPSLQHLNLAYNCAEDDGALHISKALSLGNTMLITLVLCYNSLGEKGLSALAKAMYSNVTLRRLFIWGNHLDITVSQAFLDLTQGPAPRFMEEDTDVRAYLVDGVPYLAKVESRY